MCGSTKIQILFWNLYYIMHCLRELVSWIWNRQKIGSFRQLARASSEQLREIYQWTCGRNSRLAPLSLTILTKNKPDHVFYYKLGGISLNNCVFFKRLLRLKFQFLQVYNKLAVFKAPRHNPKTIIYFHHLHVSKILHGPVHYFTHQFVRSDIIIAMFNGHKIIFSMRFIKMLEKLLKICWDGNFVLRFRHFVSRTTVSLYTNWAKYFYVLVTQ